MEEYKQLYELYQSKTDSELENIINSNKYTPIAIKVASDILKYGRIGYEETIKQQGDTIILPESSSNKQKESLNLISSSVISKILLALIPVCVILILVFCVLLYHKDTNTSSTIEITQKQSRTNLNIKETKTNLKNNESNEYPDTIKNYYASYEKILKQYYPQYTLSEIKKILLIIVIFFI